MITEELEKIKREIFKIKAKGYIKTPPSEITKTLKKSNIKIKFNQGYTRVYIPLFTIEPEGDKPEQLKRLYDKYAYITPNSNKTKIFEAKVQANYSAMINGKFLFKLHINYEEEKVFLHILDKNYNLIDHKSYWTFSNLKKQLINKYQYLLIIKTWDKTINNQKHYKYYDYDFYKLKDFSNFLQLLVDGTIRVNLNLKNINKEKNLRQEKAIFEIEELDLDQMFIKLK